MSKRKETRWWVLTFLSKLREVEENIDEYLKNWHRETDDDGVPREAWERKDDDD